MRYLGLGGYVSGTGPVGHLKAIKEGTKYTIGFQSVLKIANHISTDGENKNVGQHGGIWKFIDDERLSEGIDFQFKIQSVLSIHLHLLTKISAKRSRRLKLL